MFATSPWPRTIAVFAKTPGVMARIKSFALNILRANHTKNVAQATWENALCFENILNLNGI